MMKAKKVLALAIAAAMVVMLVPGKAYAGYKDEANKVNNPDNNQVKDGNSYGTTATGDKGAVIGTKDVTVKVQADTKSQMSYVYAVAINKTEMEFTYHGGNTKLVWNPETMIYEKETAGVPGSWESETGTVTVSNYSNLGISVESSIAANPGAVGGVTFDCDHKAADPLLIDSAAPTTATGVGAVKTGDITVTVTGAPTTASAFGLTDAATLTLTVKDNR